MSSKKDYDKVIKKSARRIRVTETIAASLNANSKSRRASLDIATSPSVSRERAVKKFDAKAKAKAASKRAK